MTRNLRRDGAVLSAALLSVTGLTFVALMQASPKVSVASPRPYCEPGQSLEFLFGFKALSEQLGERMGRPLECEHADPLTGETYQKTTTGMAVYRVCTNTPLFTRDGELWALTALGLLHWDGRGRDPTLALPRTIQPDLRRPCAGPGQ